MPTTSKFTQLGIALLLFSQLLSASAGASSKVSSGLTYTRIGDITEYFVPLKFVRSEEGYYLSVTGGWIHDVGGEDDVQGIGDTSIYGVVYDVLYFSQASVGVDLQGGIKLPTARNELGSGEVDYQAGVSASRYDRSGVWVLSADVRIAGGGDDGRDREDTDAVEADSVMLTFGRLFSLVSDHRLGIFYDVVQEQSEDDRAHTLSFYLNSPTSVAGLRLKPFFLYGFSGVTEAAVSGGLLLEYAF